MQFVQGYKCNQTTLSILDNQEKADNPVQLMDAFVDKLNLTKPGFDK